ncbi:MAG: isochorismatase family cysteine hydrolase [Thermoplasmata archaeon]|jgi:nicotinamidase-related amidase
MLPPLERPALLVIDMQAGFVAPNGAYARAGRPVRDAASIVPVIAWLRQEFRAHAYPCFFTAYRYRDDGTDFPGRFHRVIPRAYVGRREPVFTLGSSESAIVSELAPAPDEALILKNRYSAFFGTDLKATLERAGVRTVVITGVLSHVCVDATARDAFALDYEVVVVRDAVAGVDDELHRAILRNLEETVGAVVSGAEVVGALGDRKNP